MLKEQNTPKKYTRKYFRKTFPPNHNPLIGTLQMDTFANVRDALYTLRELTEVQDFGPTEKSMTGLHFLMTCIIKAVDFEIENRK